MEPRKNINGYRAQSISGRLLTIYSLIGTVCILGWLIYLSRYGIDFTDESFYLVWMDNPFEYHASITQFGYIYHPLYQLLDGNIAALRQTNILLTFGLAYLLINIFLKCFLPDRQLALWQRIAVSASFATASLALFSFWWLPTPSYNSLSLQALLIASIGLLLADQKSTRESILGWLIIGVGGWLAFMAKPTTAAALAVCAALYLLASKKLNIRLLLISLAVAVGLLVASALIIDGSVIVFINRLISGAELASYLGGGHTLLQSFRLDGFQLDNRAMLIMLSMIMTAYVSGYLIQTESGWRLLLGHGLATVLVLFTLSICIGMTKASLSIGRYQGVLLFSLPIAFAILAMHLKRIKDLIQIQTPHWAAAILFAVFPHVYAFGSGNNYWVAGSSAGVFWVLSGLVLLVSAVRSQKVGNLLLLFGIAAQALIVALLFTGIESPYRQPQPLWQNNYPFEIGKADSNLILSEGYGHYLKTVLESAKGAQFAAGTPVIDMTGQSPGILYALGATNIGQAWIIGGYPGSDRSSVESLGNVSCEKLATAWLLYEPSGPRSISTDILASFGADIKRDYKVVASWRTAKGAGGYEEERLQQLLVPARSTLDASQACSEYRLKTRKTRKTR